MLNALQIQYLDLYIKRELMKRPSPVSKLIHFGAALKLTLELMADTVIQQERVVYSNFERGTVTVDNVLYQWINCPYIVPHRYVSRV